MGTIDKYYEYKNQNPTGILFVRMGSFYEAFGNDAVKANKILKNGLVKRNGIFMNGFPCHKLDQIKDKIPCLKIMEG